MWDSGSHDRGSNPLRATSKPFCVKSLGHPKTRNLPATNFSKILDVLNLVQKKPAFPPYETMFCINSRYELGRKCSDECNRFFSIEQRVRLGQYFFRPRFCDSQTQRVKTGGKRWITRHRNLARPTTHL